LKEVSLNEFLERDFFKIEAVFSQLSFDLIMKKIERKVVKNVKDY
jgi:hypothetical protein